MDVTTQLDQDQEPDSAVEAEQYGELYENLPDDKIAELKSLVDAFSKRDQWARMVEIIRVTMRRYFALGIQHGFWNADSQTLQIGPTGGSLAGENLNEEDLFAEDFNIYTANMKIFMAVFSQAAMETRMEAAEPLGEDAAASIKAAEEAEKFVRIYERYNSPRLAQMEVAQLFWTDGRVVSVTEVADQDSQGNPVPSGIEVTEYMGTLESKCPIVEPFPKWPYCFIYREMDKVTAKEDNPKFADKIQIANKGSNPNDEIARMSRISTDENISQVSSDTLASLVTETRGWFRRSAFRELPDDKQAFWIGGTAKDAETGEETQTEGVFPNGCMVKFFGQVFAGAADVEMGEQIRVCHAMRGKGNSRPSLSDAMVPIQMEFNDALNMYSEMLHKCIPRIHVRGTPENVQALLEQFSRYGEYSPYQDDATGQPLENNFFPEPHIDVPATMPAWIENLQGPLSNFVTGNQPALFGQQMEDQKTASGYKLASDQSRGLLSIVWTPYQEFASGIRVQAAMSAAKRGAGKVSAMVPGARGKQEAVGSDTSLIAAGRFLATPSTDQNFPESWTERSNTIKTLLAASATNPILAQNLQLPDNLSELKDAIGLKNFVIEGADSRDKQVAEWAEMQDAGGPVPDIEATQQRDQQKQQMAAQAVATIAPGQTPPPLPQEPPILRSTVPVRPNADDHVAEALKCFQILNDPDTLALGETQPEALQDLELHMMAHIAAGKAKGLIFPPPIEGPPPMLPKPGMGAPPPAAAPPIGGPLAPPTA